MPAHDLHSASRRRSRRRPSTLMPILLATSTALVGPATAWEIPTDDHNAAQALAASPRIHDLDLPTGVRLHVVEQGDPDGPPIVFLHGYTDSSFSWSSVVPLLPTDYRLLRVDLRGHGASSRPQSGYDLPNLAADVVAMMDRLALPPATVVGHSMGSFVAQRVAIAAPQRVARLVLVGSATTPRAVTGIFELAQAIDALADPVPEPFVHEFQASTAFAPLPAGFLEEAVAISQQVPARVWRAAMDGMLASQPDARLGTLRMPVLILWGERETLFPRSEQEALVAQIPGAVLRVYPETGHALHWERPSAFARDLTGFVDDAAPKSLPPRRD